MASQKQYEMLYKLSANLNSSFGSAFKSAQSAMTETQAKMKALAQEQADISAYEKQHAAIEKTQSKLELLQNKLQNVEKEYIANGSQSSTLANRMLDYQASIEKTNAALNKQQNELNELESDLEAAGIDTKNLGSESQRLESEMDDLIQAEREAGDEADEFGDESSDAFTAAGQALAAAGITRALKEVYDGFMECVNAAGDFQAEMSYVEALSGASGDEMNQLSQMAKDMGAQTKFSAQESASAFSYMALAGWETESMLAGIEPVLNLAAAANMDLATASDIVTDYLTAFGLTANDTSGFVDKMAYAMSHSNTDVEQLGEAYKACAATAKSMGYSVEEVTAVLMTMANAGIKGGEAGNALNAVMTRLATDTKGCASALEEYGVHVYDTEGNMQSLSSILTGISSIWGDLTDQQQANIAKTIAGVNHYSDLQTIMSGCSEEAAKTGQSFSDYAEQLENCSGAAGKMANTMLDNMNGELTIMKSAFEGLTIAVGEQFTPMLSDLYSELADVFAATTGFVEDHPALIRAIGAFVAAVGTATAAITALAAAKKALQVLDMASMFASPVGMIMAAGGAIVGLMGVISQFMGEANEEAWETSTTVAAVEARLRAVQDTYAEQSAEISANSDNVMGLVSRLQALTSQSTVTAAEQEEIKTIISQLNQEVPGLALEYDGLTNSMNLTTDAIIAMAKAEANKAEYAALQEELIALMGERENAENNVAEAENELAAAQAEADSAAQEYAEHMNDAPGIVTEYADAVNNANEDLEYAQKGYDDAKASLSNLDGAIDETSEAMAKLTGAEEENTEATEGATEAQGESYRKMLQLKYAAKQVSDGTMDAEQAAKAYGLSVDDLNSYITIQEDHDKALAAALAMVESGYLSAEQAANVYGVTLDDMKVEQFRSALDTLVATYGEVYTAAYESISGQYNLWDKADEITATSMSTLQSNLESQVSYWQNYNSNLEAVASAAQGAGIDISGIWDQLSSGSPDAVNAVAGMAAEIASSSDGGAQSLENYVDTYLELQDAMGGTADTIASNSEEVVTAYNEMWNTISTGMDDAGLVEKFQQSAQDTIQGYIQGLGDGSEVSERLTTQANGWLDAFNAALGVHSPSTITDQSGKDTIQGFVNGVDSTAPSGVSAVESAAQSAIDAFNALMNTSTLYSAGQNAMQGAINGIKSMQASLVAAARAAGLAAAEAYKEAQDINSPSRVFEWFGEMDMQGAIQGIEKGQAKANVAFAEAAKGNAKAYQDAMAAQHNAYQDAELLAASYNAPVYTITADIAGMIQQARMANAATQATSAMTGGFYSGDGQTVLNFSPSYNLSGAANTAEIRALLQEHDEDLRELLLGLIEELVEEKARRSYR